MKKLFSVDFFYEPGCIASMKHPLRRTLVHFVHYAAIRSQLHKKYFRLSAILIFSFTTISSFSQKPANDTSSVEVRSFSDSSINAFKNDRYFQYDKILEPPQTLWDRFWAWIWEKIADILNAPGATITIWIFLIVLALAIIIFFIWKSYGSNKDSIFSRRSKENKNYEIGEENIHEISFDIEINKAISSGNFRLAVRLLYLQTLKILSDRSFIHWDQNKTNFAYVKEMEGKAQQPKFADLTNEFEYTWYGNNLISEEKFKEIQNEFQLFKQF